MAPCGFGGRRSPSGYVVTWDAATVTAAERDDLWTAFASAKWSDEFGLVVEAVERILAARAAAPEAADETLAERVAAVLGEHRWTVGHEGATCGCGETFGWLSQTAVVAHRAHVAAAIVAALGDS